MEKVNKLLAASLTRRQFLTYVGTGLLTLIGVSGILKKFSDPQSLIGSKKQTQGYGSSPYGGKENV